MFKNNTTNKLIKKSIFKNTLINQLLSSVKNSKVLIISLTIILSYGYFRYGNTFVPVEDLGILAGIGADLTQPTNGTPTYSITVALYGYPENSQISTFTRSGYGPTIGETRETRQLSLNKKFVIGLERILLLSENFSEYSIRPILDILFANPNVNDTSLVAVCKGKGEDMLKLKIPLYPSSSDYIEGILSRSTDLNFFSDNYKLMDLYVRLDAEGRNILLPYLEIKNNYPQITGTVLFDKEKLVKKFNMQDSKILNLLRVSGVGGILTLEKTPKEYINFYGRTKRKVTCEKKDNKYFFKINIDIAGEIINNELYPNLYNNTVQKEKFEKELSAYTENLCNNFISKMQNDYKVDALELGRIASAKYGRHKVSNWNNVICNTDMTNIKVNVNVKVATMGRGDY